jgi:xylulose-5-phosphate/fructose-6-phosphate phosphoketolase
MMLVNRTSRYHVAQAAVRGAGKYNEKVRIRQHELDIEFQHNIVQTRKYIIEHQEGKLMFWIYYIIQL